MSDKHQFVIPSHQSQCDHFAQQPEQLQRPQMKYGDVIGNQKVRYELTCEYLVQQIACRKHMGHEL